ncbi:MAG: hypothetical protein J6Y78_15060 [Paludibacteraceae bacterium]|nr:hypothetical protein [Paludibacteraceae bacterium]
MGTIEFRKLKASEIDARVSTVTKKGCSLLLYKDARVDQNILDETVGCLNWKRSHQQIGDRLYCTVEVWDETKEQWIPKQDVGTESYTEKEKGQASDSFKRACFNFGIGRELYTAPFIWIPSGKCTIEENNGKFTTKDRFMVDSIGYDKNRNINKLVIRKLTWNGIGDIVFQLGEPETEEEKKMKEYENVGNQKITKTDVNAIKKRYTSDEQIFNILKHFEIKKLEDMTVSQFVELQKAMEG